MASGTLATKVTAMKRLWIGYEGVWLGVWIAAPEAIPYDTRILCPGSEAPDT